MLRNDLAADPPDGGSKADNCYHVVTFVDTPGDGPWLDGFTVTGGNANGNGGSSNAGGAIYAVGNMPWILGCRIVRNYGTYGGGILFREA